MSVGPKYAYLSRFACAAFRLINWGPMGTRYLLVRGEVGHHPVTPGILNRGATLTNPPHLAMSGGNIGCHTGLARGRFALPESSVWKHRDAQSAVIQETLH